ncbi:Uncharacterized protein APZ42_006874 [Daphnia magna]|uniref:Uncharacterized protein n=1 Tax=Daphnia magna TaxID=35525 RepID=A0A164FNA7_9CRUS|nr:Uncharacterized protein APZ42_006874 [Daphnia magna]
MQFKRRKSKPGIFEEFYRVGSFLRWNGTIFLFGTKYSEGEKIQH